MTLMNCETTDAPRGTAVDPATLEPRRTPLADPLGHARMALQRAGEWGPGQMAGRRWPVACVSLEITQRCNLDCTLCYLSESSEAVRDFPLEEVFRRIDLIVAHCGPGTDVQVSGGEPTLRRRDELIAIVQRLASRGLRATLFTNGILATRELLQQLVAAGLTDVAFHVDSTQQRAGCADEAALNALRCDYIERARGLPLGVFFNTTVHAGNAGAVPMLAAFFVAHADVVRFASFQLQADTGRGVLGARSDAITQAGVAAALQQGAGVPFNLNVLGAGHSACNQSAVLLVVNGRAYDAFADAAFVQRFMRDSAALQLDRGTPGRSLRSLFSAALRRPALCLAALRWAGALAWRARRDLLAARGRVHKLTLFTHNFMDATQLDAQRIDACVFMAITQDGPLSMCAFNARRDAWLLQPLQTSAGIWQPLPAGHAGVPTYPIKWLKGKAREAALRERRERRAAQTEVAA